MSAIVFHRQVLKNVAILAALVLFGLNVPICVADPKTENERESKWIRENSELVEPLQKGFDEGFVIGPKRLQEANKSFSQARRIAPSDPRVDYAQGLVAIKQSQLKPALAQFQAAVDLDANYWPARQALIWTQFVEKKYEPGFKQLVDFAKRVQAAAPAGKTTEAQHAATRWIGQVLAAASQAETTKRHSELIGGYVDDVFSAIGDELWGSLEEGREIFNEREFVRGQTEGLSKLAAERSEKIRRERKTAQIDKNLDAAAKAKDDAEKSKEEWKTWIDRELTKSDQELERLEANFKDLEVRGKSLFQSITSTGQEITAMELTLSTLNPRTTPPMVMQNAQQQYSQRQSQLLNLQFEYNANLGRMSVVAQAGAQATALRDEKIAQYEKSTGELVKKNAALTKWSDRLSNQKQKMAIKKPGKGGADKAADKKNGPPAFRQMVPFDLQHEKDLIIASLKPPVNESDDAGADEGEQRPKAGAAGDAPFGK